MELRPNLRKLNEEKKKVLGKLTPQQVELMIEKKYSNILQNFPIINKMENDATELKEFIKFFDEKGIPYIYHIRCGMIKSLINEYIKKYEELTEQSIFNLSFYIMSIVKNIIKQLERIDEYLGQLFFFEYQSYNVLLHYEDGKVLLGDFNMKRTKSIKLINRWIENETKDLQKNIEEMEDLIDKLPSVEKIKDNKNWELYYESVELYHSLKKNYDDLIEDGFKSFRDLNLKVIKETFLENNPKAKEENYKLKDSEWVKYDMQNFRIIHKGEENFSDVEDFKIHLNMEEFFDYTECYNCTYKNERNLICCDECYNNEDWNHEKCLELCDCECEFCEEKS